MALSMVHSSSICARHSLILFKVLHRLHFSKAKLARIFPNLSPVCDRCKQAPATVYPMLWSCPKPIPFWSSFFDIISKAYDFNIEQSPTIGIFGVISVSYDSNPATSLKKVIAFSSLLASPSILFKWKDEAPPSPSQWIKDVMQNIKLEKTRCTLNGSTKKFYKTWNSWMNYVNSLPGLELWTQILIISWLSYMAWLHCDACSSFPVFFVFFVFLVILG